MYRMLSLRQFQQFLAVAETMNFRRAAERLNMAQPPLTAAIRQMEDDLGVRLFERTNRITSLTQAGEIFREEAMRTISQAERAVVLTRRAGQGSIGTLRMGFVASAVRQLVPQIIARFRQTQPSVVVELEEATTARQVAAITADRMDVGIVALPLPADAEGLLSTKILIESHLVAALPTAHPLARATAQPLRLAELAREPWVLFPGGEGPGLYGVILRSCAEAGFSPRVSQRGVQMETIVGLVAAGLGVAVVPEQFRTSPRAGVIYRDIGGAGTPIPYRVGLAWRSGQTPAVLSAFLDCMAELDERVRT
ncbi:LysR family transcriptional regulator [Mesorhizobium sp. AD1-1]|uniref:LysR family transcriptional regulator n=1 Tax=Mesorhizobium sp. AD1-1 TaxID=2876621 RepID=UPI001CCF5F49|nr:LysR family transcriptional regulator [Mesorhizobium sp. AD1-1]MBZ9719183.1 LysR family transcriptional regulator [Mesorhizobium sp. AD1-1]